MSPARPSNLSASSAGSSLAAAPSRSSREVTARIRNLGEVDAAGFDVAFFGGDPGQNGVPLGVVPVSSLAAGADVVVSVDWSEVNLRGTTLLFVVVDAGGAVEEFDETDNRTFKVVDITGLADLAGSTASLRLEPAFPRSGEGVSLEATFSNLGERDALDVEAEVRLDHPETGAVLASETFPRLLPGEVASFDALWDSTGVEGEHRLFLVLDVLDAVREQREDNNVIEISVALQDSDLFVTPLYFSPDGNGVQDEAAFFYRVSASPVSVHVADEKGLLVRSLEGEAPAVWDGRTDKGLVARDGDYFFVVESDGVEIARRRVVLDTNRSSVVEALGTEYVGFANLTCPLDGFSLSGPAFLPDDSAAFFITQQEGAAEHPAGLYRAAVDGSLLELIATGGEFSTLEFFDRFFPSQSSRVVSPDGQKALARRGGELALLDLATGSTIGLGRFASDARWSPDGSRILVSDFDGIYLYAASGELLTELSPLGSEVVEWSPDGLQILYRPWNETVLHVMNADGTNDRALPSTDAADLFFDPDGPVVASSLSLDKILWTRGGEAFVFRWSHFSLEVTAGPFEVHLGTETLASIPSFEEVSAGQEWATDFSELGTVSGSVAAPESRSRRRRTDSLVVSGHLPELSGVHRAGLRASIAASCARSERRGSIPSDGASLRVRSSHRGDGR
jgi:hypothetical protein